ncbi:MAG: VWA domain-containing protein [Candidatus Lokiarchaeota archaeon]|nr:VWA domain-containing protein [Candidatus Lokiarchaeota archaeon]
MPDIKIEDTVILLDTSRSMLRKDFKPSRLVIELQTAKNFIQSKLSIDMKDRISVITFGEVSKKLIAFAFEEDKLINSLKKIQISGRGYLHEGIAFALQVLVEEMRKIGGKTPRIFIITDNKLSIDTKKIGKMVKIAKGLGVFIDACQLGGTQDYGDNSLKRITQLTGGEYGYFNNSKAIINAGNAFASKKNVRETADYFSPEKKDKIAPLVSEIALPLRRPTLLDIRLMAKGTGKGQEKCQICHSVKAAVTGADFYSEGRFCPSCDRAMHLSCAAMWAKKTEYKDNVFRCPFCFFLLELPRAALKLVKEKTEETQEIIVIDEDEKPDTKMALIPNEKIDKIDSSCSYCHSIFLGDFKVFQCENCNAYYHEPCLEKMKKEIKACRYCGAKITID